MTDKVEMAQRIRAAAVEHDGVLWIRQCDAIRIMGISDTWASKLQSLLYVRSILFTVPKCRKAPGGLIRLWRLDDVLERVRDMKKWVRHQWRPEDDELIRTHGGRMPSRELAAQIGCSLTALYTRRKLLGIRFLENRP